MSRQLVASTLRVEQGSTFVGNVLANGTGTNEVVTLTITGTPTGGSVILFIAGLPVTLAWNSSTASTTSAINAALGAGSVSVTGGTFPALAQVVTFSANYAGSDIPLPVLAVNGLTGGTAPTMTITSSTPGAGSVSATSVATGIVSAGRAYLSGAQVQGAVSIAASAPGEVPLTLRVADSTHALIIPASSSATSERAGITMGTWLMGQDVNSNGGLDFFVWNGSTRLSIAATGAVGVGVLNTTGKVTIAAGTGTEVLKITGETSYMAFYADNGTTRRSYIQGTTTGMNLGADGPGTVAVQGALTTTLGITADTNIYAVGQVKAARNGGTSGSGATDGWYYNASFYASAADVWGTGVTASIAFHPGGYAPQLRTSNAYHGIFVRDSTGNSDISMTGFAFTATSTRRIKKNIASWPARSLSSAAVDALSIIDQLRPVSYNRLEDRMAWVPTTQRRREALLRLHQYQTARGLPLHVEYHDCAKHECPGTVDSPCPEMINHTRTNIGLIAEEVYEVLPEAVTLDEHGQPRALNYAVFSVVALAAIKELVARIETIEAQLAAA